jgi:hypothetical protein
MLKDQLNKNKEKAPDSLSEIKKMIEYKHALEELGGGGGGNGPSAADVAASAADETAKTIQIAGAVADKIGSSLGSIIGMVMEKKNAPPVSSYNLGPRERHELRTLESIAKNLRLGIGMNVDPRMFIENLIKSTSAADVEYKELLVQMVNRGYGQTIADFTKAVQIAQGAANLSPEDETSIGVIAAFADYLRDPRAKAYIENVSRIVRQYAPKPAAAPVQIAAQTPVAQIQTVPAPVAAPKSTPETASVHQGKKKKTIKFDKSPATAAPAPAPVAAPATPAPAPVAEVPKKKNVVTVDFD